MYRNVPKHKGVKTSKEFKRNGAVEVLSNMLTKDDSDGVSYTMSGDTLILGVKEIGEYSVYICKIKRSGYYESDHDLEEAIGTTKEDIKAESEYQEYLRLKEKFEETDIVDECCGLAEDECDGCLCGPTPDKEDDKNEPELWKDWL